MAEGFITRRGGGVAAPLIPEQFIDTSGSAGSSTPHFWDETKDIAYYGLVSPSDLYTSDELASAVGVSQGTSRDNESLWHKYYWNGGIHFWRRPIRHSVSWSLIANQGAVYGTGTTTSRKGHSLTSVNQNKEIIKNSITYIPRLMEGSTQDPTNRDVDFIGSEWNLILGNLHVSTNSGSYSTSPTDGITYANFNSTAKFSNDDFVGWKTNFGDSVFFQISGVSSIKWTQEAEQQFPTQNAIPRGVPSLMDETGAGIGFSGAEASWFPVLTVKHPSFTTYGKSGGFNQNEPDW